MTNGPKKVVIYGSEKGLQKLKMLGFAAAIVPQVENVEGSGHDSFPQSQMDKRILARKIWNCESMGKMSVVENSRQVLGARAMDRRKLTL